MAPAALPFVPGMRNPAQQDVIPAGNHVAKVPGDAPKYTDAAYTHPAHAKLDKVFAATLLMAACKYTDGPLAFPKKVMDWAMSFPDIYKPVFDWKKKPMTKFQSATILLVAVYFLIKSYVIKDSKEVVKRAHKKYVAHKTMWAVALHAVGSSLEILIGALACCRPDKPVLTKIASALALNNIATGFWLTPGVFGIKHLTVPGFYLFGVLRLLEIIRTAFDYRNYPQAWVLLQVGTMVRLLGYFVLPFSSTDGVRGDLFTEPSIYSFNILLSGYLTSAFVYPPKWVMTSLLGYMYWQRIQPPRISIKRRPRHEGSDESYRADGAMPMCCGGVQAP